jgi:hypothetical protein
MTKGDRTMGFMTAMAPCFGCGRVFGFNPERVPSIRVDGVRQPVCEDCMERANAQREAQGLEPHPIMPGAYEAEELG